LVSRFRRCRSRGHEHIHRGQFFSMHAERFPDQPAQAVAVDGTTRRPRADGHPEPRTGAFIARILNDEQGVRQAIGCPSRALELGGGVKLVARPQSVTPRRTTLVSGVR
jgi:hypothetical protein